MTHKIMSINYLKNRFNKNKNAITLRRYIQRCIQNNNNKTRKATKNFVTFQF